MSLVERKQAILPPLRRKTVDAPAIGGEVIAQALTLSDSMRISLLDGDARLRIPHILAVGILAADQKPLWTAEQWDQFGSIDDNRVVCMELCNAVLELSNAPKKTSPQTSSSLSASAA